MAIIVENTTLDSIRADADSPVASCHGYDVMAKINAIRERLRGIAARGASAQTLAGHIHDHNGLGRGILRSVNGGVQILTGGVSYVYNNALPIAIAYSIASDSSGYYPASPGSGYQMGLFYLSPGVTKITIVFVALADDITYGPKMYAKIMDYDGSNLGDSSASPAVLTTAAKLYTHDITVTRAPSPLTGWRRCYVDLKCVNTSVNPTPSPATTTYTCYSAEPFEIYDGA